MDHSVLIVFNSPVSDICSCLVCVSLDLKSRLKLVQWLTEKSSLHHENAFTFLPLALGPVFPWFLIGCLLASDSRNADTPSGDMWSRLDTERRWCHLTGLDNTRGESHTSTLDTSLHLCCFTASEQMWILLTLITEVSLCRHTVTDILSFTWAKAAVKQFKDTSKRFKINYRIKISKIYFEYKKWND